MSESVSLKNGSLDKRWLFIPALFLLSPLLTSVVPRLTWLFLALIAIACCVRALRQHIEWRQLVPLDVVVIAAFLTAFYVSVNAIWIGVGYDKAALLWGLIFVTIAASTAIAALDQRQLRVAALWFAVGTAVGVLYLVLELFTNAALTRAAMNSMGFLQPENSKHAVIAGDYVKRVSLSEFNQNATIVMLALWPALSVCALVVKRPRRALYLTLLFVVVALAMLLSQSQSSQMALIASLAVFVFAWKWRKAAIRLLAVLWCLAFVLVLPLDILAYKSEFHMASWLPSSARARVILWEYTAQRSLNRPWFGVGVDSTRTLKLQGTLEQPEGFVFPRSTGSHAHNLFLQTWYELGLVGAILMAFAGAAVALRMLRLPTRIQPFAAAGFATFASIGAFAWSIWQTWFMCAIALLIIYVQVTAGASRDDGSRQARGS